MRQYQTLLRFFGWLVISVGLWVVGFGLWRYDALLFLTGSVMTLNGYIFAVLVNDRY